MKHDPIQRSSLRLLIVDPNDGVQQCRSYAITALWPAGHRAVDEQCDQDDGAVDGPSRCQAQCQRRHDRRAAYDRGPEILERWWAYVAEVMETEGNNMPMQAALKPVFLLP